MEKIRYQVGEVVNTAKTVVSNAEEFVVAVSLAVSTFYNYYDLSVRSIGQFEYYVRLGAVAVTGLFSLWLLVRHFNKNRG